jgi:hypothetical protein
MSIQHLCRVISVLINTNNNINITTKMELYSAINNYTREIMTHHNTTNIKLKQFERELELLKTKNDCLKPLDVGLCYRTLLDPTVLNKR